MHYNVTSRYLKKKYVICMELLQNSNETTIFWKCLSTLNVDELKKLLVHYFIKVVDLKESGRENDEIISKLDVSILYINNCMFFSYAM